MNALLAVVRRQAESGSVIGRRDYALLLFYFLPGLRRSDVIGLRGGKTWGRDGALIIRYRRKGEKFTARKVSDPTACEALSDYLRAAGGSNVLGTQGPLWTPHDPAGVPGALLSSQAFVENLKGYT